MRDRMRKMRYRMPFHDAYLSMGVSLIGVAQSLLAKRQIQCACLGAVFKFPMSRITVFEDALMVAMSGWMLWTILF